MFWPILIGGEKSKLQHDCDNIYFVLSGCLFYGHRWWSYIFFNYHNFKVDIILVILLSRNKTTYSSGNYSHSVNNSMKFTLTADKAVDGNYNGDMLKGKLKDK